MLSNMLLILASFASPDYFSQEVLDNAYKTITPATVLLEYSLEITDPNSGQISKQDASALGVLASPDGLILTHGHFVIENKVPFNIMVTVGQGENEKRYEVELLEKPDDINIAFLHIKEGELKAPLPYVRFDARAPLSIGAPLMLFGVLGESLDYSRGVFPVRIGAILEKPRKTYCLDQSIRFGYVGGPVINTRGEVVGLVGFDLKPSEGGELYTRSGHPLLYQNALFADYIQNPPDAEDASESDAEEAWLGVFTQPLTEDFAAYWELPDTGGLIISTVVPGSPAAEAGLLSGDIITNFDGTPIRARKDRDVLGFTKLVRETGVGREVLVHFLRNGEAQEIRLTLGLRPRSSVDANEYVDEIFGLTVREITTDMRIALNLPEEVQGVIVRRVKSGSIAQVARMRAGVIILSFGDHPVASLEEFKAAVEKVAAEQPKEISVFAQAGPKRGFFRLTPHWEE